MYNIKKVLNDRVLLKPEEVSDKTEGGLYKPKESAKAPKRGTVVDIGEGKYINNKLIPISVEVGDVVLYEEYAGKDVHVDDTDYVMVREQEIMLVLEPKQ